MINFHTAFINFSQKYFPKYHRAINRRLFSLIRKTSKDLFSWVQIEINTSCNRRCCYCPNATFDNGLIKNTRYIDESLYRKIIDELKSMGFSGSIRPHRYNEPLLDKRIFDFVRYAKEVLGKDARVEIVTNGDYLNVETYLRLVKAGINSLLVTIHPPEKTKNLQETLDYRKEHGTNNVNLTVQKLDPDWLHNRGGLLKLKNSKPKGSCKISTRFLIIDHQGNIPFCCNDYFVKYKMGNIRNSKIIDVWWDSFYRDVRKKLRRNEPTFDLCKNCGNGSMDF